MRIHTVNENETMYDIGRLYGTHPMKIAENNGLKDPDKLTVGQKLLILTPTRTYTVKSGDTAEMICARFGIDPNTLYKNNPCLWGESRLKPRQILAIRYDTPTVPDLAVNGYCYSGCNPSRLTELLPYLNYLTVSAAVAEGESLKRRANEALPIEKAKSCGVKTLFRIYDTSSYESIASRGDEYFEKIADMVSRLGYDGLTVACARASEHENYGELVEKYKRYAERYDLLLFAEVDGNRSYTPTHSADGYVFSYEKCHEQQIKSFKAGEEMAISEYSERQEATYSFLELPSLAYAEGGETDYANATSEAARGYRRIEYDPDAMVCQYERKRRGRKERVIFPSLENIKARLELCSKLGFRGVSIDVMRSPTEEIMLFSKSSVSPKCNL